MTTPLIINEQQQIEAQHHDLILPTQFVGKLLSSSTPSVKNVTRFTLSNTSAVTITDFRDGQEGQQIWVLGDGVSSVEHNTIIHTITGTTHLLLNNRVYGFVLLDDVWRELSGSDAASIVDGGGGGVPGPPGPTGATGPTGPTGPAAIVARDLVTIITSSLASGATERGSVSINKSAELLYITVDRACRVNFYSTALAQTNDIGRALGFRAPAGQGICAEFSFAAAGSINCGPIPTIVNNDSPEVDTIYYAITNNSLSTSSVSVTLRKIPLETV